MLKILACRGFIMDSINIDTIMKIIANIFSFFGACFLILSAMSKNKNNVYKMQLFDCCSNLTANILLQGWSGATTTGVAVIRNLVSMKGKMKLWIQALLCFLLIFFGLLFNNRGPLGLLPIMASVEFTIVGNSAKASFVMVKLSLLANLVMWCIYNWIIGAYPMFIADIIAAFMCINTIVQHKKNEKMNKNINRFRNKSIGS
jgi:hypothetical protein